MSIAVSLCSEQRGEIRKFLEKYYDKQIALDEDVEHWIYVYHKPVDAIDIISIVVDNRDKYDISLCVQIDAEELYPVTFENHNDVIKGILCLYYEEYNKIIEPAY